MEFPVADRDDLARLEGEGLPTIHNLIAGDAVLRTLDYEKALAFVGYVARRFDEIFTDIRPSMILGGFDGFQGGLGLMVARKLGIPWYCLNFTTIPPGYAGFCSALTPQSSFSCATLPEPQLRALAELTIGEFVGRRLTVKAYISANNLKMILKRVPAHARAFGQAVRRVVRREFDPYTHYRTKRLIAQYLRRRRNLLMLPKGWFLDTPPPVPYVFFGMHTQPESSIDVWAPFFADQFAVVEQIARATPPSHRVLIKLHKSDADNYSRSQLKELRGLPGVQLVSPFASSRDFIEHASVIFAIQGNIALEAGILGRPTLMFGDSKYLEMPSVDKVKRVTDLPAQIRAKIVEAAPDREAIVRGFMTFLRAYGPGCYNDWQVTPSPAEIEALAAQFRALRQSLESAPASAGTLQTI